MSASSVIYICGWLIRDTFRQALANRVFWFMLTASAVVIFFCLGISIEAGESLRPTGDLAIDRPHGYVFLAFGAWRLPLFHDGEAMVQFILLVLGEGAFGIVGTLLALILTAGFVPEFLQPGNATVLLSKPTPRWVLLLGKYLGVLALLGFHISVFVIGTFLALGLRTGFWVPSYLWGIPILLLHFAAVYSFCVLLAVMTRSSLVCVIGSVVFWFLCWGMNYGRHMLTALGSTVPEQHPLLKGLVEVGYWILPKPMDLGIILHKALDAQGTFGSMPELQKVQEMGAFYPDLSILSCLAFAVCMIVVSARQLSDTDY